MREILFRGKRIDNGEWVVGYCFIEIGCFIKERPSCISTNTFLVDPETVGQYTGLKDKNGTKIFEGDIVKLGNNPIHDGVLVRCIYADWRCGFVYEFLTGKNKGKFTDMNDSWRDYERIGNIHDNPELLEVEE